MTKKTILFLLIISAFLFFIKNTLKINAQTKNIDDSSTEITFNDLTINVVQKKDFTAFDTINLTDLIVSATYKDMNIPVKLTSIKYQNDKYLEVGDSINLLIEYNNQTYEYNYSNLRINKKIVDFKNPTLIEFIYDGNLKILDITESELYTISDNQKTEIGNYIAKVTLKDTKNYIFNTGLSEISIEWSIIPTDEDIYTNIEVISKIGSNFTSLTVLDKNDFTASAMLNNKKVDLEIKTIIYENHDYISINDSYVKFELHHNDKKIDDYKFFITVSKNIVDFNQPEITTFYFDGEQKKPVITENNKYTITNIPQTNIGKYEAKIEIVDKVNYEFKNTKTTLTIPWEIKEPIRENILVSNITEEKYYSLATVNISNFSASATINNIPETKLQVTNINYQNGNYLHINDTHVILTLNYKGFEFKYTLPIKVEKNVLKISIPNINKFTYDGFPKSLNILPNDNYQITNNTQTKVGNYQTIITIIDKENYTFENNLEKIIIDWEIISRGIINLNIEAKINSFNSLSTIDKNNFTITADLDGQQINLKVTKIIYNNGNNLQINDKFVTLNINYLDTNLTYKFNIYVTKNVIDFIEPKIKKFVYDGSSKQLSIPQNSNYTIKNNQNINAGTYQTIILINDPTNYMFNNNSNQITITWEIEKAKIKYSKDKREKVIFEKNSNLLYSYDKNNWAPYTIETAIDTKYETVYFKINDNYEEIAILTKDLANWKVSKSNGLIIGIFALTTSIILITTFGGIYYIKNKRKN